MGIVVVTWNYTYEQKGKLRAFYRRFDKDFCFWILLFFGGLVHAQHPFPHPDSCSVSLAEYHHYKDQFYKYIEVGNLYKAGIQIGNVFGDIDLAYKYIHRGLKERPMQCHDYYYFYHVYHKSNFLTHTASQSVSRWLALFDLCDLLIGEKTMKDSLDRLYEHKKTEKLIYEINNSSLDMHVSGVLELMEARDQEFRSQMSEASEDELKDLWKLQHALDSINIRDLDMMLTDRGYPLKEEVGYALIGIPCLIMHHCSDLNKRMYYDSVLVKAVKDGILPEGNLEMFRRRTEEIRRLAKDVKK